eukprot:7379299-Prymnesium_polylepis.3
MGRADCVDPWHMCCHKGREASSNDLSAKLSSSESSRSKQLIGGQTLNRRAAIPAVVRASGGAVTHAVSREAASHRVATRIASYRLTQAATTHNLKPQDP